MTKEKAEALFLRRFEALIDAVKENADPVVRISRRDWHWIEPSTETVNGVIRYQGVEILVVD